MLINPKLNSFKEEEKKLDTNFYNKITLSDAIKRFFLMLVSFRIRPLKSTNIDLKKINNILLLRNDGLGDYVLTTPLVKMFKNSNPDVNIDVVASFRNAKLIEADTNIRKVFQISHKGRLSEIFKISRTIRKFSNYDLMVAAKHTKITNTSLLFNLISKKSYKIGFKIAFKQNEFTQNSYRLTFNHIFNQNEMKYFRMLQEMMHSIANVKLTFNEPYLLNEQFTKENKKDQFPEIIQRILINISGSEKPRIMSESYLIKVKEIIKTIDEGIKLCFTSSPDLYFILDKLVYAGVLTQDEVLKLEIVDLIKNLPKFDLIITPDTSITHFASVLNVPQIILYDTIEKYKEWSPDNRNYIALISEGNINDISYDKFEKAVKSMLNNFS